MRRILPAAIFLVLAGCGAPGAPRGSEPQLYEVSATVLENAYHGPEACIGVMTASLPPSCGGVPLIGWDWDDVTGEEAVSGVTWGEYRLVGTYDGETFSVTEAEPPGPPTEDEDYGLDTPCKEPPGGWDRPDPAKTRIEDYDAAIAAAQKESGYSIAWIDAPVHGPEGEPWQDIQAGIINAAFTGNLKAHEAVLREHWGGALCVVEHDRSNEDRERIFQEAEAFLKQERRLDIVFGNGTRGALDLIEITVVFADQSDRAALEERFGIGAIRLISRIVPVS